MSVVVVMAVVVIMPVLMVMAVVMLSAMSFFAGLFMRRIMIVTVVVRFPDPARARGQQIEVHVLHQGHDRGTFSPIAQGGFEEGLQVGPDPDHHVRILQTPGFGRAHGVAVR